MNYPISNPDSFTVFEHENHYTCYEKNILIQNNIHVEQYIDVYKENTAIHYHWYYNTKRIFNTTIEGIKILYDEQD